MLNAVTFHREIRAGSSLPLVVDADDGRRYVLKARGSGDGDLAVLVDFLALGLGRLLGLPVLEPCAVRIEPGLASQAGDPEVRELLERSPGVNFATPYVDGARPVEEVDVARLDRRTRTDVFLFDLFVLNIDRYDRNPNAIVGSGGFRCLDFSSSMAFRGILLGRRFGEAALLSQIRRNPFYEPGIDPTDFVASLRNVSENSLRDVVGGVPEEWWSAVAGDTRAHLAKHVKALTEDAGALGRRLEVLASLRPETDEDRYRRSEANKAEFRRRFGEF